MGVFKVNGKDITTIAEVISTSDKRKSSTAFSSGKLKVTGLSDSGKTLANAPSGSYEDWGFHNIVGNKLKVNGTADSVSKKGCRPNFASFSDYLYSKEGSATVTITYDSSKGTIKAGDTTINASVLIFQLVGAGGGGGAGGYSFWGSANGGGGGGGGGSIFGLLDFNNMPGGKATVVVGAQGSSGSGEGSGGAGGASYINDGNGTRICTCNGGGAGTGDTRDHVGGKGGSGGTVSCIADCSYFRCFGKQTGGNGGNCGSAGGSCSSMKISTPDGVDLKTVATSGGAAGSSGNTSRRGGGGGASGSLISPSSWSGGSGGADDSNSGIYWGLLGGGGGGGGADAYSSNGGYYGGNGYFQLFYDSN